MTVSALVPSLGGLAHWRLISSVLARALLGLGLLLALACGALAAAPSDAPRKLKADPAQEYYLYLPKDHDPRRPCRVFVAVHDTGCTGEGALGWSGFADEGHCIVLAPTLKGNYQFPSRGAGDKLKAILTELAKDYKLEYKVFLTGFGAGAQFAHRYALENPYAVVGCAAHSADAWTAPDAKTRPIVPFLVTCGLNDTANDRIGAARKFAQDLAQKRFKVDTAWFKNIAHEFCDEARAATKDFYWTVTTGMTAAERDRADECLLKAKRLLEDGKYAEAAVALKDLMDSKPAAAYVDKANAVTAQIEAAGKEKLAKIDEQAKTDVAGAIGELEKIRDAFEGTRVADAAARRLRALREPAKAEPKPQPEPKAEEKPQPPKQAADAASKMDSDCRSWLRLAENFIANKRPGDAHRYLIRIMETYPDSEFAAKARAMIEELRKAK